MIHCPADVLGKIADLFPRLTIIAAHMGGMDTPQEAAKHLAGKKNVYFDTAFASHFLDAASFTQLVKLHGADKVLFATDCPWSTLPAEKGFAGGGGPIPQREGAHCVPQRGGAFRRHRLTFFAKAGRIEETTPQRRPRL